MKQDSIDRNWMLSIFLVFIVFGFVIYNIPVLVPMDFCNPGAAQSDPKEAKNTTQPPVLFVDRTLEQNLNFVHSQGDEQLAGMDETLGPGACAADFNGDGWVDLFLVNGSGQTRYYGKEYWWQTSQGNALFFNEKGHGFRDVTESSGLGKPVWGMGCLSSDFDNDGDIDLLVTGKGDLLLYANNGKGVFVDATQDSGITGKFWATSAAAADFNGDGLLDIYLGNFVDFDKGNKTYEANSQFTSDKKNAFNPSLYKPQPKQLFLNLGQLKFKEVGSQLGVQDAEGRTLDVSWQTLDDDALPDLLVSNAPGTASNTAFINQNAEHFTPSPQTSGIRSASGSRGIASGNLNTDETDELVLATPQGEGTIALFRHHDNSEGLIQPVAHYRDLARETGIAKNEFLSLSAWTPLVQDFNNDGFNDVFIAAGSLEPDPDAPKVTLGQAKQLLINSGHGSFYDASLSSGIALQDKQSARGAVSADFDNDGDIDVYVAHNNDLGQYLSNESPKRNWLGLKLVGVKSNRDAAGAKVRLTTGQGTQTRTVTSGEGFLSDSDKRLLFGLGDGNKIEKVTIQWPDGNGQTLQNVTANKYWLVEEDKTNAQELTLKQAANPDNQPLQLKFSADQVDTKIQYAQLLSKETLDGNAQAELSRLAHDPNPSVRLEVIKAVSQNKSGFGLKTLVRSLEDGDAANVAAAIKGLQFYEEEASVRWLLRLFRHPASAVKIALADCFAFFYQEEEAVVHRKYLAVPYLIRLLDESDAEVKVAALRALAAAERFRGVHVLLAKLNEPNTLVRSEVVRTLGLIRQRQAVPELWKLVEDNSQPAEVIANALIALKRMDEKMLLETLAMLTQAQDKFASVPLAKRLDVLAVLIQNNQHEPVFDTRQLTQLIPTLPEPKTGDTDFMAHWIAVKKSMPDANSAAWLDKQTRHSSAAVRLLAFQVLYGQGGFKRVAVLQKALQDGDATVFKWAAEKLLALKANLSADDYQKVLANEKLRAMAVQIWTKDKFPDPITKLESALHTVFASDLAKDNSALSLTEQACDSAKPDLQEFCPILLFSDNTLANQQLAAKILQDPTQPIGLRLAVLAHYDEQFDKEAINILYNLAQSKNKLLHLAAVSRLFDFKSNALTGFAEKIAGDTLEDSVLRLQAVAFLVRQSSPKALQILYSK